MSKTTNPKILGSNTLPMKRHIRYLTGVTAKPKFLQRITHLVYNFRPDAVTKIDTVRAFHN
ncbi:unnamed protein product, partial [Rotaria sordida]